MVQQSQQPELAQDAVGVDRVCLKESFDLFDGHGCCFSQTVSVVLGLVNDGSCAIANDATQLVITFDSNLGLDAVSDFILAFGELDLVPGREDEIDRHLLLFAFRGSPLVGGQHVTEVLD